MRQIALGCLLLAWCSAVPAQDAAPPLAQYAHKAWRIDEGFSKGYIASMAQTPDGYLWLGTEFGLLRFDGVRAVPWRSPAGAALPGRHIRALFAARDGTLWIGTLEGLASWRDGTLTLVPQLAGIGINSMAEDREGTLWVTGYRPPRAPKFCAIRKSGASCETNPDSLGAFLASVYVDSRDRVWLTSSAGIWQWRPEPAKLHSLANAAGSLQGLAEGERGGMLVVSRAGVIDRKSVV